jgi:transaldolase
MKIFPDTANLDELRKGAAWGIVDGVTTNPTLIAKEGNPFEDQIRRICEIVPGDVSAEVLATDAEQMIEQGRELARLHPNVVVKCPLTRDGIQATAARAGAHLATLPFKGLDQFLKDYRKVYRDTGL